MSSDKGDHDGAAERTGDLPDGMHGEPLGDLLDEATSSLRDDAELRLDVRAELASHLEDKRDDFIAKGHSSDEALDLARQSFGSPEDIARDLLAANRRRMKLRALARLALRAVALPAAALAVLSIPVHRTAFFIFQPLSIPSSSDGRGPGIVTTESFDMLMMRDDMPPPEPMHWAGDGPWYAGLRKAWEADISNAPLAARYLRAFAGRILHEARKLNDTLGPIAERRGPPRGFEKRKRTQAGRLAAFERDVARAGAVDPENAYWRYLHAGVLASAAVRYDRVLRGGPPAHAEDVVVVLDRAMFRRAIDEYLTADAMDHVSDLRVEVFRARTAGLPPPDNVACAFRRVRVMMNQASLPLCPGFLSVMPQAARLLAEGGDRDRALRLLDSWDRLCRREVERAWEPAWMPSPLDRRAADKLAEAYVELGHPERAEVTRTRAGRVADAMRTWREGNMSGGSFAEIEKHGGFSARFGSFWPTEQDLEIGRRLDQALVEDAGLGVLTVFLFALLSICGLVTLRWLLDPRADSAPVAVMPTPRALAKIIGAGLVAPLAVYWAYSRLSGIAARVLHRIHGAPLRPGGGAPRRDRDHARRRALPSPREAPVR
ncbi:MAG: permease prefix domain 1-containing protein [Planctomycetota bacterium]|jgi:hypothetical protein